MIEIKLRIGSLFVLKFKYLRISYLFLLIKIYYELKKLTFQSKV